MERRLWGRVVGVLEWRNTGSNAVGVGMESVCIERFRLFIRDWPKCLSVPIYINLISTGFVIVSLLD